jgi:hypothetical protein
MTTTRRKAADRYVRRGGPIPQIYPGTLAGLEQGLADALSASRFMPEEVITLTAVHGKRRTLVHAFLAGRDWAQQKRL